MKSIIRTNPPDCLDNSILSVQTKKIEYYNNLKDSNGKIKPRWNSTCLDSDGVSKIRKQLLSMSDESCAYCGKKITNSTMDVDHYLPASKFNFLAYCWENYLPSCKYCNQNLKHDFIPKSLENKNLAEEFLINSFTNSIPYNKENILNNTNDRIIEPSFDNIETHLEFDAEFMTYKIKSEIGKITNEMFFKHSEVTEIFDDYNNLIKSYFEAQIDNNLIFEFVNAQIKISGYEFYLKKFYEFWLNEKNEGRI